MNRSKQTIVESKWLTCENALSFLSSVGTAFSFLLPDLLLWAFLWLSEFLILNNYKFQVETFNLGFRTYETTKIKTTWIKLGDDAIATWNVMNSSQWTSHFVQVSINDLSSFQPIFPTLFFNSFFQPKNFRNHDLMETYLIELFLHPILISSFSGIHGRRSVSFEIKPWISDPFEHILHHFVLSSLWLSRWKMISLISQ